MDKFLKIALEEAEASVAEGGLPIGSAIVRDGVVLGVGRNRFRQSGDPTTHAEMEAIRDAAARSRDPGAPGLLAGATCYTTMMPCEMCAGALIRFGITRVIVAETTSYVDAGTQPLMEKQDIEVVDAGSSECAALVERYCASDPRAMAALRSSDRRKLVL